MTERRMGIVTSFVTKTNVTICYDMYWLIIKPILKFQLVVESANFFGADLCFAGSLY